MFQQAFFKLKQDNDDRQSIIRYIRDNPKMIYESKKVHNIRCGYDIWYNIITSLGCDYCITFVLVFVYHNDTNVQSMSTYRKYSRSNTSIADTWIKHYELHTELVNMSLEPNSIEDVLINSGEFVYDYCYNGSRNDIYNLYVHNSFGDHKFSRIMSCFNEGKTLDDDFNMKMNKGCGDNSLSFELDYYSKLHTIRTKYDSDIYDYVLKIRRGEYI